VIASGYQCKQPQINVHTFDAAFATSVFLTKLLFVPLIWITVIVGHRHLSSRSPSGMQISAFCMFTFSINKTIILLVPTIFLSPSVSLFFARQKGEVG